MTEAHPNQAFSEVVTQQLTSETRELWVTMADYFVRGGPEAVKTWLDAEKDRLESNVRSQLERLEGS